MDEQQAETLRIAVAALQKAADGILHAAEEIGKAAEQIEEYLELQGKNKKYE